MEKGLNLNLKILGVLFAFFLSASMIFAVENFSVSPISINQDVNASSDSSAVFTILNTGDESLNLSISKNNLILNSNSIQLNLNQTEILNLNPGDDISVSVTFNAGSIIGLFRGNITVENDNNSSMFKTIPVNINVIRQEGALVRILGVTDRISFTGEIGDRLTRNLIIINDGDVDLTGIRLTTTDLRGIDSGDRIRERDIEFNDENFNIAVGDDNTVRIRIDVPRTIDPDVYEGTLRLRSNEGYEKTWDIRVVLDADNLDIRIRENSLSVRNGLLEMVGKEGERLRGYSFLVENNGDVNVRDVQFELERDLEEENSANSIPRSAISFIPSIVDIDRNRNEDIEVRLDIPTNQAGGTYYGTIRALSSTGEVYDTIRLKVRVVGDIYVSSIDFSDNIVPGGNADVTVNLVNQGSRIYRDVRVSATLFNVDGRSTDITQSIDSFILDVGQRTERTLRFRIPEDAKDSSSILEVRVSYGSEQFTEITELKITRPVLNLVIESNAVNPVTLKCEDNVFTFLRVRNLGRFDEDIKITSQIIGTNIISETSLFRLDVDSTSQRNLVLDVSGLEPGEYTLSQRVVYSGNLFNRVDTQIRIDECSPGTGIIVQPGNETVVQPPMIDDSTITIFGVEMERTTAYLAIAVGFVFILIILTLFLL